jgi:hypothetical protein
LGQVSLAAEVQLLKRELSRCHALLNKGHPADNNFLSVVTLVEAALASLTWKGYTPKVLNILRRALAGGECEGEFSFEHYDAIRREFKASAIPTGPTIGSTMPAVEAEAEGKDAKED